MESDCTGSSGKVAQPTTSTREMACLENIIPRPTDRNVLPVRADYYAESRAPSSSVTSKLPVNRPEDLSTYRGRFPKRDFSFLCCFTLLRDACFSHAQIGEAGRGQSDPAIARRFRCAMPEVLASSVLRTVRLRACGVQGFCKNAAPAVILEFNETDSAT